MNIHEEFIFELTDLGVEILKEFYKKEHAETIETTYSEKIKNLIFTDLLKYLPSEEKTVVCKMQVMFEILRETKIDWQKKDTVVFVNFRKNIKE